MKHRTKCPHCGRTVKIISTNGLKYLRLHRVKNGTKVCTGAHKRVVEVVISKPETIEEA